MDMHCEFVYIAATAFQIAGSILLAFMVTFRKDETIILMGKTIIPTTDKEFLGIKDALYETIISRFGFIYMVLGYILQFYIKNFNGIIDFEAIKTIVFTIILFIFGYGMSKVITEREYPKLNMIARNNRVGGESFIDTDL